MNNLDITRIKKRFKEIEIRLNFLKKTAQTPLVIFLTNHQIASAAERDLEVVIQACLDIADQIIASGGFELPKHNRKETFAILASHGIIPAESVYKLSKMASQRNILVHEYMEIEQEQIYETIKHDLGDITGFVKAIQKYLDKKP